MYNILELNAKLFIRLERLERKKWALRKQIL